jgi:hypothetical protein
MTLTDWVVTVGLLAASAVAGCAPRQAATSDASAAPVVPLAPSSEATHPEGSAPEQPAFAPGERCTLPAQQARTVVRQYPFEADKQGVTLDGHCVSRVACVTTCLQQYSREHALELVPTTQDCEANNEPPAYRANCAQHFRGVGKSNPLGPASYRNAHHVRKTLTTAEACLSACGYPDVDLLEFADDDYPVLDK